MFKKDTFLGSFGHNDALGDRVYSIRGGAATPTTHKRREWPRPSQKDGPIVQPLYIFI